MTSDYEKAKEMITTPRVLLEDGLEAIPSKRAKQEHGIIPDLYFIRPDCYALGSTKS